MAPRAIASLSDSPVRYSMMKYGCPSVVWPKSRISTMFACAIMWIARASLKKRATMSGSRASTRVQQLDGDLAADHRVLGQIDDAHAALTKLTRDSVVTDRVVD